MKILVVVDPTVSRHFGLERAAWLAKQSDAQLELFICEYDQYLAGERFFDSRALEKAREGLLRRHRKKLEKLSAPLQQQGIEVTVSVVWDKPLHDGILRKIEDSRPDLIVKETHYHSAIKRSVFSNTDWNIIRECQPPLWLVKPHDEPSVSRLMAAVDPLHERDKPSSLDRRIIQTAKQIAAATGAELKLFHAFDPAPVYAVSTDALSAPITEPIRDAVTALRARHQAALEKLADNESISDGDVLLVDGETREALVNTIEETHTDVLVIGAVSRSALQRFVLGSTAERVLDFVPCDLLIVKPGS